MYYQPGRGNLFSSRKNLYAFGEMLLKEIAEEMSLDLHLKTFFLGFSIISIWVVVNMFFNVFEKRLINLSSSLLE